MAMDYPEVWISVVTNRGLKYLLNISENFSRQSYPNKKLCVILNSDTDEHVVNNYFLTAKINVTVLSMPKSTLGECLNRSIDIMPRSSRVWSKMDDDDFYGPSYISRHVSDMIRTGADIVGRRDMQLYVPEIRKLYFMLNGGHNKFTGWVQGSSMTVKSYVFSYVRFPKRNKGEDTQFQKDSIRKGFKIFASSLTDYVVIRHVDNINHTWKIDLRNLLKRSFFMGVSRTRLFERYNHVTSSDNFKITLG